MPDPTTRPGFSIPAEGEAHGDPGECEVEILTGSYRGLGEGQTFWNDQPAGTENEENYTTS